jgi:hypothetical protein
MGIKWIISLLVLATAVASGAPAWKWVDENGVVHYSDRPVPGAEEIDLPAGRGFAAREPSTAEAAPRVPAPDDVEPAQAYEEFTIASPAQQETLWNIGGNLSVQVSLSPGLRPNHRLDILLDGQRQFLNATSTTVNVSEVYRGLHTLQAAIYDAAGAEVLRSLPVEIMVQQTSIQNPNNPNRPSLPITPN